MKAPTFLTLSCLTLFLALAATHARSDEPVPYPVGEQLCKSTAVFSAMPLIRRWRAPPITTLPNATRATRTPGSISASRS